MQDTNDTLDNSRRLLAQRQALAEQPAPGMALEQVCTLCTGGATLSIGTLVECATCHAPDLRERRLPT